MGKGGERLTISSNFQQYGLPGPLDLIRLDVHRNPIRPDLQEVSPWVGVYV
jgi:tRNA (guanine10-N2)-methyltransferase